MQEVNTKKIGFIKYAISLLSNVVFQGVRYMSLGEKVYKASLTILPALLIDLLLDDILLSIFISHMLNYILNGQFYVVYRYYNNRSTMTKSDLDAFLSVVNKYIHIFNPLDVLAIGSFCKGKMSDTSDLDLRIFHEPNLTASINAYLMATLLRLSGLFMKFPIDIYCFSDLSFIDTRKVKVSEIPVNFRKNKDFLNSYPKSMHYLDLLKILVIK
jgi:hypothetical protein